MKTSMRLRIKEVKTEDGVLHFVVQRNYFPFGWWDEKWFFHIEDARSYLLGSKISSERIVS